MSVHILPSSSQVFRKYDSLGAQVITGSTLYIYASTYSGSPVLMRGNTILDGFTALGAVTAGDILVVSDDTDYRVSGSTAASQTPIGVAYNSAVDGGNIQIIRSGIVNLTASGSITRGNTVGTSVWGAAYVQKQTTGSQVLGVALHSTGSGLSVAVLLNFT